MYFYTLPFLMDTKKTRDEKDRCPVNDLLSQLSKMRILPILLHISQGGKYFSSLKNSLEWISSRTLSLRLKELQENDFIIREIVSEQPLKIEYRLSKKGESFSKELDKLSEWARKWQG